MILGREVFIRQDVSVLCSVRRLATPENSTDLEEPNLVVNSLISLTFSFRTLFRDLVLGLFGVGECLSLQLFPFKGLGLPLLGLLILR